MSERHPSNTGNHPVLPDREDTGGVFQALLDAIPAMTDWTQDDRKRWEERWRDARSIERRRRDYDREWDRSTATVSFGR